MWMTRIPAIREIVPLSIGVGVLASVLVAAALLGDLRRSWDLLGVLRWGFLAWLVPLAIVDHGLRYLRWEVLLNHVASARIARLKSVLAFSAGSLLIFTPARAGEVAKSFYARHYFGVPVSSSAPILIAERLGDFAVMSVMAMTGLLLLGDGTAIWAVVGVFAAFLVAVALGIALIDRVPRWPMARLPIGSRLKSALGLANRSRRLLLRPRTLRTNLGFGVSAWSVESAIFFFSLAAAGATIEPRLLWVALAVFPLASVLGSISFLPGGVGVTEGALAALAVLIGDIPGEVAVLAALLSRAAILGVVVLAGLVSSSVLARGTRPARTADMPPAAAP